jgi:predicted TIM-barrel fold metal-dependent hydrolase
MAYQGGSPPTAGTQGDQSKAYQSGARSHSRREVLSTLAALGACAFAPGEAWTAQKSGPTTKSRLIDVHHHILPPVYLAEARDRLLAQQQGYLPARILQWSPQNALSEMDQNEVATSIVSISPPGIWFGDVQSARALARKCNEYAAQLVRDYPGRFGFFASAPLPDTEGSLKEIAYALDVLKGDGIIFLTSYGDKWPGDPAYAPVFDELNRRKALVFFHPAAPNCCRNLLPNIPPVFTELPHDTTRAITSLLFSGSFARFRDVRFIFSQAGGTVPMLAGRLTHYSAEMKDLVAKIPNGVEFELKRLYYDIASSANPPAMAALMKLVPTSQILFGGDYPYVSIAETADGMTHLGLSPSDLQAIGRDNALALLPRLKGKLKELSVPARQRR